VRPSCENSSSQARDFGLPRSPNLPFRGTGHYCNWCRAFAVEFCCDTKSSVFLVQMGILVMLFLGVLALSLANNRQRQEQTKPIRSVTQAG
jgi:hypothetical protein